MATDASGAVARKTSTVTVKTAPEPQKPQKPQKPASKPDKQTGLPATGDASAIGIAVTAGSGLLGLGAALIGRRRR